MVEGHGDFLTALSFVLAREGGYVNNPDDPGGETNMGITKRTYLRYCKVHGLVPKSMHNLGTKDVAPIYEQDYWYPVAEFIPFPLCVVVFDTAVNMGPARARKYLALHANDVVGYVTERWGRYLQRTTEHPPSTLFLPGWCNRLRQLLTFCGYPKLPLLETEYPRVVALATTYRKNRSA